MPNEPIAPAPKPAKTAAPAAALISATAAALSVRTTEQGPLLLVTFLLPDGKAGEVAVFPDVIALLGGRSFVAGLVGSSILVTPDGSFTAASGKIIPRYRFAGIPTLPETALAALGL